MAVQSQLAAKSSTNNAKLLLLLSACVGLCVLVAPAAILAQTVKTVHSFSGPDGEFPDLVTLAQGRDGRMYGTTLVGGVVGQGTIFKQRTTGNGNVDLYSFSGTDGAVPAAGVTLARDGKYYGTTEGGGSANLGTLF